MRALIAIAFLLAVTLDLVAEPSRIAVIDTGINKHKFIPGTNGLCDTGHKDFTHMGLDDDGGHGTNVSGIIHQYAKDRDYCQVIIKYHKIGLSASQETENMSLSLEHALTLDIDAINISAGGVSPSWREQELVAQLLNKGVAIIAAAGNHGLMLNSDYCDPQGKCKTYNFYPAGYDKRIIVVGNKYANGEVYPGSNYGELVDLWKVGVDIAGAFGGLNFTGTSQATAIASGEYMRMISPKKPIKKEKKAAK